ncbi:MAG: biopolymer transporter ExbD, partial [Pararhodobacter sp.]|nr:biopolymer transporter ExbD [Pararhodobacter sp.]
MFTLAPPRPRRRPRLTPMIDVVFLLLIFFMLAARFGQEITLPLGTGGGDGGTPWQGPPRLVEFAPGGALWLNGVPVSARALPEALAPLTAAPPPPVLQTPPGASHNPQKKQK